MVTNSCPLRRPDDALLLHLVVVHRCLYALSRSTHDTMVSLASTLRTTCHVVGIDVERGRKNIAMADISYIENEHEQCTYIQQRKQQ
jgi:hypothetical protein